jgi:DNA-binding transcriptional LysR family regulator
MNAAASALGQSQATIARRVRAVEDGLGVALFRREPNRLVLTEAGRALVEAASPMGEAAARILPALAGFRPDPRAPVRITATASVTMFLSRHSAALEEATAPTEIAYIPTARLLDLSAGEADLALRMHQRPEDDDIVGRRLGRIAFTIFGASPDCAAVIAPSDEPHLANQAAVIRRFAGERPIVARIGDMATRYQAVRSGLGAAVLPFWIGNADPRLMRLSEGPPEMVEDIYLIMHRRSRHRPAVMTVVKALTALFRAYEAALMGFTDA